MTIYFADSSALVKRYLPETGSAWLTNLVIPSANHRILIARITLVEMMSAVARRKREGTIVPRTAQAIQLVFIRHADRQYNVINLSKEITLKAVDLLNVYPIRAYDAVQLSSALLSHQSLVRKGTSLIFLSADTRLLAAATQEGLTVDNPNNH